MGRMGLKNSKATIPMHTKYIFKKFIKIYGLFSDELDHKYHDKKHICIIDYE